MTIPLKQENLDIGISLPLALNSVNNFDMSHPQNEFSDNMSRLGSFLNKAQSYLFYI